MKISDRLSDNKTLSSHRLSDKDLYKKCKEYGARALAWRRKFGGLLPEVSRRELYEKKGYFSIFEFAAKLAGMSRDHVSMIINLDEKLVDFPKLRLLLVEGEVSPNKLIRVVSVLNKENEDFWAGKVKSFSNRALEVLVRDHRTVEQDVVSEKQNGLFKPQNDPKALHVQRFRQTQTDGDVAARTGEVQRQEAPKTGQLNLSAEVQTKLLELQSKGIDINEMLMEMLNKRGAEIEKEKEEIADIEERKTVAGVKATRHMPAKIDKIVKKEYGKKCSIPNCNRDSVAIHHTQRFSLIRNHNPFFLAPLCKGHHEIAHSIDEKFQESRKKSVR